MLFEDGWSLLGEFGGEDVALDARQGLLVPLTGGWRLTHCPPPARADRPVRQPVPVGHLGLVSLDGLDSVLVAWVDAVTDRHEL